MVPVFGFLVSVVYTSVIGTLLIFQSEGHEIQYYRDLNRDPNMRTQVHYFIR